MTLDELQPILTTTDVKDYLRVSRHAVIALIKCNKLRAIDCSPSGSGRAFYRIRKEDFIAFLNRPTPVIPEFDTPVDIVLSDPPVRVLTAPAKPRRLCPPTKEVG